MVYIQRISPEDGITRIFKGLSNRVQSLETRPSGNIVIRDTLTSTDPESGVSVVIGKLPDGTTGLQEFVNDVTPPNQPSTPVADPALGSVVISWDGKDVGGGAQPADFARTEVQYRPTGSTQPWSIGAVIYDAGKAVVPNLTSGTRYSFSLVSFDTNNNESARSAEVVETPNTILDNTDVSDAIEEVRAEAEKAVRDSAAASSAAQSAETAANAAAEEARRAAEMAGTGSGGTIFSETAPTDPEALTGGTLWIDISGTPAKNTPNRWDGEAWVKITDIQAINAAAAAVEAERAAVQAAADSEAAARAAGEAQTAANGKSTVWYQNSAPTGTSHADGDTWFNTANGNEPNRWDRAGNRWVSVRDTTIATAKGIADSALSSANGKNKTWIQTSRPALTGNVTGDTWVDTSTAGGNKLNVWNGSAWVVAQDTAIAAAQSSATSALTAANGKNKIVFNTTDATGTTGYVAGDLWMKRNPTTGVVIGQWEFTSAAKWEKRTVGEEVIGNLSAGKITSGIIDAERLDAAIIRTKLLSGEKINAVDILASNSITATSGLIGSLDAGSIKSGYIDVARLAAQSIAADKLIIGQGINLLADPGFLNTESNTARANRSTGTWTFGIDATTGQMSAKTVTATTNNQFFFSQFPLVNSTALSTAPKLIPARPGQVFAFDASVSTSAAAGIRWNVECVKSDGTVTYASASPTVTATGRRSVPFEWTVPAGVIAFSVGLACLTSGVTWIIDAGTSVAHMVNGRLIVNGAMDAKTITGAFIQSRSELDRGIKINDSQFVAYNDDGTEALRLDGKNSIITGPVIRTGISGPRTQMDQDGVTSFGVARDGLGTAAKDYNVKAILSYRQSSLGEVEHWAYNRWPGLWFDGAKLDGTSTTPKYFAGLTASNAEADGVMLRTAQLTDSSAHSTIELQGDSTLIEAFGGTSSGSGTFSNYSTLLVKSNKFDLSTGNAAYQRMAGVFHEGDGILRLTGVNGVQVNGTPLGATTSTPFVIGKLQMTHRATVADNDVAILFDFFEGDTDMWQAANATRLYATRDGIYFLSGNVIFSNMAGGMRGVWFRKNGSTRIRGQSNPPPSAGQYAEIDAHNFARLVKGDYIEIMATVAGAAGAVQIMADQGTAGALEWRRPL